jgi:3D-(3,5/4)-trihydroxycyclohexane-1,2-dione acylhydrolase (decyclizing)
MKHRALSVVGDALEGVRDLDTALGDWHAPAERLMQAKEAFAAWNRLLDDVQRPTVAAAPTYAQVIGVVNARAAANSIVVSASGGLPGELAKNWRIRTPHTFDCEWGYSCMGYEIAGGWGAAMADPGRDTIVMVGDGAYLMMNSDIYSTVLTGHKMIVVVCDNGGYGVINRLQEFKGGASFNNLIRHCRVKQPFAVDFVKHAEAMGALGRSVKSLDDLGAAIDWARSTDRTTVISIETDAYAWTVGDAWWDVGVPEVSERPQVRAARAEHEKGRAMQRSGV